MTQYVKKHFLCINRSIVIFICLLSSILANATPAFPGYIEFRQPDGSIVKIKMMGDEYLRWAETEDGYSLLFDKSGYLVYADHDSNGDLVATSLRASEVSRRSNVIKNRLTKIGKKIMYSEKQIAKALEVRIADAPAPRRAKALGRVINPVVGIRKNLVILVDFPDLPFTYTQQDFDVLMNSEHPSESMPSNASVRDYYREASFGQLDLQSIVVGVYRMPQPMAYYGSNSGNTDTHAREMIIEAINQADEDIDFSEFDNDGDGRVDGIHIIYAGYGEEAGGGSDCIWSHSSQLSGTVDGVSLGRYSCSPELRNNYGKSKTHIGVICHELGHVLGTMDFYDTNYGVDGSYPSTGQWDMMAQGNWNGGGAYPAFFNPYTVIYDFGWADAINGNKPSSMSLEHHNKNGYVRINTPTEGEYFLLEYRDKASFDIGIPGHGLMIYRASDNLSRRGQNTINAKHPQQFYPLAANAPNDIPTFDLSSYGVPNSESCAFPGALGVTEITDYTTPSMRTWTGLETGYPITNIEEDQAMHSVSFDISGGDKNGAYDLRVTDYGSDFISLEWKTTNENATMMLVYNSTPTFGTPINHSYAVGDKLDGGGEVLNVGTQLNYKHENLLDRTNYYYIIYSWVENTQSWRASAIKKGKTITGVIRQFPYIEDFESKEIDGAWQQEVLQEGGEWLIAYSTIGSQNYYHLRFNSWAKVDNPEKSTRMILPVMDFTGIEYATLSFEYSINITSVHLMYRKSLDDEWHFLCKLNSDREGLTYLPYSCYVQLPELTSEYQLCIVPYYNGENKGYGDSSEYFNIDNITVSAGSYIPTSVFTRPVSTLGNNYAIIPIHIELGTEPVDETGIEYSADKGINWISVKADNDTLNLDNLLLDSIYYYRSYAKSKGEIIYGNTAAFRTLPFANGKGTKEEPFTLNGDEDWNLLFEAGDKQRLMKILFTGWYSKFENIHFVMSSDASVTFSDLDSDTTYHRLGYFYGSIDGCAHKLKIISTTNVYGLHLFYYTSESSYFKNINFEIESGDGVAILRASLLAMQNYGYIDNCTATMKGVFQGKVSFAPFAEENYGTIINCQSTIDECSGNYYGITTNNMGYVEFCTSNGLFRSSVSGSVGGMVHNNKGYLRYCTNKLNIESSHEYFSGGGIAINNSGKVSCCVNKGAIKNFSVAGIVSYNTGEISNCYTNCHYSPFGEQKVINALVGGNYGWVDNLFFGGTIEGNLFDVDFDEWAYYSNNKMNNCYVLYNNSGDNTAFSDKDKIGFLKAITRYDLISKDFVDTLNYNARENIWSMSESGVILTMETSKEKLNNDIFFDLNVPYIKITTVEATITGKIQPIDIRRFNKFGVEWKDNKNDDWHVLYESDSNIITQTLNGLQPFHLYYYRAYAIDRLGNRYDSDTKTFATKYEDITNPNDTLFLRNIQDLRVFAQTVKQNNNYKGKVIKLLSDIDLGGAHGCIWEPITGYFQGEFDGGGHYIVNMNVDTNNSDAGFFGFTGPCSVHDLHIRNSVVKSNVSYCSDGKSTSQGVGGIIGYAGYNGVGSFISRCSYEGKIIGGNSVGAIAGMIALGRIEDCYSKCDILDGIAHGPWIGRIAGIGGVKDSYFAGTRFKQLWEQDIVVTNITVGNIPIDKVENSYYLSNKTEKNKMTEEDMKSGVLLSLLPSEYWCDDNPDNPINDGFPVLKNQASSRIITGEPYFDEYGRCVLSANFIKGLDASHTHFGFEWFSKSDNVENINKEVFDNPEKLERIFNNIVSGISYYYRSYAATETKDTIWGEWIEFEKTNSKPIPYISGTEIDSINGNTRLRMGITAGDDIIERIELEYCPKNSPEAIQQIEIKDLSIDAIVTGLQPLTVYEARLRIYGKMDKYESKPIIWLTPVFGVERIIGDANNDGRVTLSDIVVTTDNINGISPGNINRINADVLEDGYVNKHDVLGIKDILMDKPDTTLNIVNSEMKVSVINRDIEIDGFKRFDIKMENLENITAFNMDIEIPSDIKVKDVRLLSESGTFSHKLYWKQNQGTIRILSFSHRNDIINNVGVVGNSNPSLFFLLEESRLPYHATLDININNCVLADNNHKEIRIQADSMSLKIIDPCLVNGVYYKQEYDGTMTVSPKCIGSYSGKIVILDSVFYKGVVRPVKNIDYKAFYRNNDIDSVEIAGSVDEISFTFNECKNLKDVVLHEGIKRIGQNTFAGTAIKTLRIPASVNWIEGMVRDTELKNNFNLGYMPNLEAFEVSEESEYFKTIDGVLYTKDGRILVKCPPTKKGVYFVPEHVDTIGYYAFDSETSLNMIIMNGNVKTVGEISFGKNTYLLINGNNIPSLERLNYSDNCKTLFVNEDMVDEYKKVDGWKWLKILPISDNDLIFKKGWNWATFSFIAPETCDLTLFSNAAEDVKVIENQTKSIIKDPVIGWAGNMDFQPEECYRIYSEDDLKKSLYGANFNYEGKDIIINKGWNWLPYYPAIPLLVSEAIDEWYHITSGVIILGQDEFAIYEYPTWKGDFVMQPDKGYMVYYPNASTSFLKYKYIAPEDIPTNAPTPPSAPESYWTYDAHAFANTMPVIAKVKDAPNPNYEVAAVVNEECRGVSRAADGRSLIAVHGETGETVRFHMYDRMNGVIYEVNEEIQFTNDLTGSFQEPLILTLGRVIGYSGEDTSVEKVVESKYSDVYSIEGVKLIDKATPEQIRNLPKGIYVINGRKVMK